MSLNRRHFLKSGVAAAAIAAIPRPCVVLLGGKPEAVPPMEDPRLADLAARALDSARAAGATYADVRLTHTRERSFAVKEIYDDEDLEVGVRALVDGYWGFVSGPIWSPDELARLGREAVHQAKINTIGGSRSVTLAPAPVVDKGQWATPVIVDPFAISPFEVQDFILGLALFANSLKCDVPSNVATAIAQEKVFASTSGSYYTQRCNWTQGSFVAQPHVEQGGTHDVPLRSLARAGMGWELYTADRIPHVRDGSLREELRKGIEEAWALLKVPVKPIEVGRYDVVFDAYGVATLLDATLGRATELDRALGYEANASGTSYLSDPLGMLGKYQAGAAGLTVKGNRSEAGGAATVKWDDEGVAPDEFTIVKDGVLSDFQTTRETASWLQSRYQTLGTPLHSHGCANAPSAIFASLPYTPNLTMTPGSSGTFETLKSGLASGIAMSDVQVDMDFQGASGMGLGTVVVMKNGKPIARWPGAAFLFRSTELWKSLVTTGSEAALRRTSFPVMKGEPPQTCHHSVTAPPTLCKGLTFIDSLRKA